MKKLLIIALMLILVLSLAACGGSGGGGDNGGSAGGGGAAAPAAAGDDDPCPCCPNCIQKECECIECGDNDKYDCKCKLPGGGSITYNIEIKNKWVDIDSTCPYPGECGMESIALATVTMGPTGTGYSGTASGTGEYLWYNSHYWDSEGRVMLGKVAPGTAFDFKAMLAIPNPNPGNVIRVGFDFSGEADVTMNWPNGEVLPHPGGMERVWSMFSGIYYMFGEEFHDESLIDSSTFEYDPDSRFVILGLPLTDGVIEKTFTWDGLTSVSMTITLTPA